MYLKKKHFPYRHINDLKQMWTEFENMVMTNVDDCVQTDHMIDKIEATLTKQHSRVKMKVCG
jgi:hypothetical protein